MTKIDEIKEQIGLNKFIMSLISIVVFSMTGFTVSNYAILQSGLLIVVFITIMILVYVFTIVFSKTINKINDLKEL